VHGPRCELCNFRMQMRSSRALIKLLDFALSLIRKLVSRLFVASCLTCHSNLKVATVHARNVGKFEQTSRRHIPDDSTLHSHCCEEIKSIIQGVLVGRRVEFRAVNSAVIYRLKRDVDNAYQGRREDKLVTEDSEIGFPRPGDTDRHGSPCSRRVYPNLLSVPYPLIRLLNQEYPPLFNTPANP
jgi:hypothetical protein